MIDRRTMLVAAAVLPLAGCAASWPAAGRTLRVATFNIWHDAGDWPARLPVLVAALREADADVIALQEVLEDAGKGLPNQAVTIAAALGGYVPHFASADAPGAARRYGNALLSRLRVVGTASHRLEPLNDYRTALRIRVDAGDRPVGIVCTHLAHQPDAGAIRARQLGDLLAWLPRDGAPTAILGDFNAPLSDAGLATLAPRFVPAALPDAATTTLNPARGHAPRIIDHVFAERTGFDPGPATLLGDRPVDGVWPSDHFGVAAALTLR